MRNTLFVLILLNVLAFCYQHWVLAPANPVDAFYFEQEVPGLNLLTRPQMVPEPELEALEVNAGEADVATVNLTEDGPEVTAEPQVEGVAEVADRCLKIGPFSRIADAANVRDVLEGRDMQVNQVTEEGQVWMGHWVQVIGLKDAQDAARATEKLEQGGITDVYVLPDDAEHRISLGVFRLRTSATTLVRQAGGLGLKTRIDDRYQQGSNHWLRVRMPGDGSLQDRDFKSDAGQIVRSETIKCPPQGI